MNFHDWTLLTLVFDWKAGSVNVALRGPEARTALISAEGVSHLDVPQSNEWGPSVSINKVNGPFESANGIYRLEIAMQSGDIIAICAASFIFPQSEISKSVTLATVVDRR
jgi:hypothetical protein